MTDLTYTIGAFDAVTRTVSATFTHGEISHSRTINACMDHDVYDEAATRDRVAEVALGVAAKIAVGAITQAPEMEGPVEGVAD